MSNNDIYIRSQPDPGGQLRSGRETAPKEAFTQFCKSIFQMRYVKFPIDFVKTSTDEAVFFLNLPPHALLIAMIKNSK